MGCRIDEENDHRQSTRRSAWAVASALLPQPPRVFQPVTSTTTTTITSFSTTTTPTLSGGNGNFERQFSALRSAGLEIDKFEALRRLHVLQRAMNPVAVSSSTSGASSMSSSMFSPRAGGLLSSSSGGGGGGGGLGSASLFRQSSFDTARSTHSTGSGGGGGGRLSFDVVNSSHYKCRYPTTPTSSSAGASRMHNNTSTTHTAKHHASFSAAAAAAAAAAKQKPLNDGLLVFQVDADSLHALACCPLISPDVLGRPIVTATRRHGVLEFAAQPPMPPSPPPPAQAAPPLSMSPSSSSLAPPSPSLHHQHHQHYHQDQLTVAAASSSVDTPTAQSGLLEAALEAEDEEDHLHQQHQPASPLICMDDAYFPTSSSPPPLPTTQASSIFSRFLSQIFDQSSWALDPMERDHHQFVIDGDVGLAVASALSSATSSAVSPSAQSTAAAFTRPQTTRALALAAHPTRQLFISGCEVSGRVHLWQFGGPRPVSAYTPVSPKDLSVAQADGGLLSFAFSGGRTLTKSTSVVGRMSNWGGARGLAFSPNGERFAAVGEGGVVATWRLGGKVNRATDIDGAVCAEWWNHVSSLIFLIFFFFHLL